MVEPIQGSAGIVDPPKGYLKGAFDLCKKYNVLFIADEVQTGLCRAGSLLKSFDEGIKPDLVCLGKALGGGVAAISAVIGSREVMDILEHGDIGSTMAANPPATAAACAALDVLVEENICQMAREKGELLKTLILEEKMSEIASVSGDGMLRAVVLNPDMVDDMFNGSKIAALCATNGLIVNSAGGGKRIRLCPPPTIDEADLREGVKLFAKCVREVNKKCVNS
jgi:ornithine--oxo-acid transaminase